MNYKKSGHVQKITDKQMSYSDQLKICTRIEFTSNVSTNTKNNLLTSMLGLDL